MLKEQARIGMKVFFGRSHGEKTLGRILKCNPAKAKVEILEDRGNGRGSEPGSIWLVPYSTMTPTDAIPDAKVEPLEFNQFQPMAEQFIIRAIYHTYSELSPENLSCDGEISHSQVRARYASLQRRLKGLFAALGREVTEEQAEGWDRQRRDHEERFLSKLPSNRG
jgi:hypothetical protein